MPPVGRRASKHSSFAKDPRRLMSYDFLTPVGWRVGEGYTLVEARQDCMERCGYKPTRFRFRWYLLPFED